MIEYYVENGILTREQADRVVAFQKNSGISLEEAIVELNYLDVMKVVKHCKNVIGK